MKKTRKSGFTIVELVIVIAVIAILAAVLIPTFSSIIKKANYSSDQQNIRNMNTALATEVIPNSEFEYAGDAINALYASGWNSGKLETYSKNYSYAYSLEKNKMFLLNDAGEVVFPAESVEKSTLWGFYYDAVEGTVSGISKYIAFTNITNSENLEQSFGTSPATIDLNKFYFGVEGDHTNITIINGGLVKGNVTKETSDSSIVEYEVVANSNITSNTVYENKIFQGIDGSKSYINMSNVTYKNCVFYDCSVRTNNASGNVVFDGCSFIGKIDDLAAIELYHDKNDLDSVTIKNCTFSQTARGINITSTNTNSKDITIEGCTFNGCTQAKYLIQVSSNRYIDNITIKNNNFASLGNAVTIIRFHDSYTGFSNTSTLNNFKFSGNTVNSNISSTQYIDIDGTSYTEFYNEALSKFTNGLK